MLVTLLGMTLFLHPTINVLVPVSRLESRIPDARHAVRQYKFGQAAAINESSISDARHAVRQYKFGQAAATFESITPDARHAVRQCQFGHATATAESTISYARHTVRYDTVFASNNQCIGSRFNY